MKLLKTDTYELVRNTDPKAHYAILSHRWEPQEIDHALFRNLKPSALHSPSLSGIPGHLRASAEKIRAACATARQQGIKYLWIDTLCIDWNSHTDRGLAINSAFQWFQNAVVCYVYLRDATSSALGMRKFMSDNPNRLGKPSEWFGRCWTLQELLAPRKLQFYDKRWKPMGTRLENATLISKMTGIDPEYMTGKRALREASCATRMSWMAGRETARVEDVAYSLIGIFAVNLEHAYHEGTRAFERLQRAIMSTYGVFDESLFAWESPQDSYLRCYRNEPYSREFKYSNWGLLAPSPDCFRKTGNVFVRKDLVVTRPAGGFALSHQGVCVTMSSGDLKPGPGGPRNELSLPLNCWRTNSSGTRETIVLKLTRAVGGAFLRAECNQLRSQKDAKPTNKKGAMIAIAQPSLS